MIANPANLADRFYGTTDLSPDARQLVRRGVGLIVSFVFLLMATNTFFILYALEKVSYVELGLLLALQFFVQAISDYPTGAVSDWIGQRRVFAVATLFMGVGYLFLSNATSFWGLAIAFVLLGIGQAQESGTWISWFDNNYKMYAAEDTDRRTYSYVFSRFQLLMRVGNASAFILGGLLVTFAGRSVVFFGQGIVILAFTVLVLVIMRDHPNITRPKPELKNYLRFVIEGVKVSMGQKTLRYVILGITISSTAFTVWGNFILFPLYESYGKSDAMAGVLRAFIFLIGAGQFLLVGSIARKLSSDKARKVLALSQILTPLLFFGIMIINLQVNPAPESFSWLAFFGFATALVLATSLGGLQQTLMPRLFLDIIPDKNRNSVYSLMPTFVLLAGLPGTTMAGWSLETLGLQSTLAILGLVGTLGGLVIGYGIYHHRYQVLEEPVKTKVMDDPTPQPS